MLKFPNFPIINTPTLPEDYSFLPLDSGSNYISENSYSGVPWAPFIPSQALLGIPNWFMGLPSNLPVNPHTGMPMPTGVMSGIGTPVAPGREPLHNWFISQYSAPRVPLGTAGQPDQSALAALSQLFPVQKVSGMDLISNPNYNFWSAGILGAGEYEASPYYSIARNPYIPSGQFMLQQKQAQTQGLGSGYIVPALAGYLQSIGMNWNDYSAAIKSAAATGKSNTQWRTKRE